MRVWYIEQICWDADHKKGQKQTLLVEARTCADAARLAGEADGVHDISFIRDIGPIVVRQPRTELSTGKPGGEA